MINGIDGIKPAYSKEGFRQTYQSYTCYVEKEGMRNKIREKLNDENKQVYSVRIFLVFLSSC